MDLEIARQARLLPIGQVAEAAGLLPDEVEPYGRWKAKIDLEAMTRLADRPDGKLVVVTALTPTPLGEGKTVTCIGSSLGLARLGHRVFTCIRQPSMGPVFGIKGGAAGGGRSQVVPPEDFNLHLTGDIHAIGAAHNLAAAALDSRLYHEEHLGYATFTKRTGLAALRLDPAAIHWRRVVDLNDRALRHVRVGLPTPGSDGNENGVPRDTGFDIAVASELMAILALATDLRDLRARIGRVVLAHDVDCHPVTAEDLGVAGAMAVLLRETVKPTLMQTLEHTPCFIHAGPFANIAHGNSSIIADRIALKLSDYVVTEAGFGSDMGFEKFCDIKARVSGQAPAAAVLVATVRAVKMHSGRFRIAAGRPLPADLVAPNQAALEEGLANLAAHVRNVRRFGVPVVVAVNRFPDDHDDELRWLLRQAEALGAHAAVVSDAHARGGEGALALAEAIVAACRQPPAFTPLYPDEWPLARKIETIATTMYGAAAVEFAPVAAAVLADLEARGYGRFPVCMAKTHLSLSHDASRKGAPTGFAFPVREVHLSAGAGFVYVLAERISTMPGLGSTPGYMRLDLDEQGRIVGLF